VKTLTVNEILTRVSTAIGVGDASVPDPFSSSDKLFVQLKSLLQDAGDELVNLHDWEVLQKEETFTTDGSPSYTFPSDFSRMIPGTQWDRASDLPVSGGLTPQDWQYVQSAGVVGTTIYASFRKKENALFVYPAQAGFDIAYEYISRNWVKRADTTLTDEISAGTDEVLYDSALIRNYLRAKFYEAKGFDTVAPEKVASMFFNSAMGQNNSPRILSVGNARRSYPLLDAYRSVPDTGYGS
jgi:hypothetical protein